jgi:hypothetical protein
MDDARVEALVQLVCTQLSLVSQLRGLTPAAADAQVQRQLLLASVGAELWEDRQ